MEKVLTYYYCFAGRVEYIDEYHKMEWAEIDGITFCEFFKNDDGTYQEYLPTNLTEKPLELSELYDYQYDDYQDSINNESNQMSVNEEIDFIIEILKEQGLYTQENIAWVYYWVQYCHAKWESDFLELKKQKEAKST